MVTTSYCTKIPPGERRQEIFRRGSLPCPVRNEDFTEIKKHLVI